MHVIETDRTILEAEDGLILGNGDLSVSVYQRSEHLVWRFGKTDVWDRRVDLSDDFEPVHIDEIRRGIRDEGWVSNSYRGGEGRAAKGAKDPKRMKEVCTVAPSYAERQVPCPKPVGELWMHLPIDKPNMRIHQRLTIERAELEITITWDNGGAISLLCFIHPRTNVLVVRWQVRDWNSDTAMGHQLPVWFAVYRWADPTIEEFRHLLFSRARNPYIEYPDAVGLCPPLPAPTTRQLDGRWAIEQTFYPDLEYTEGFKYFMMPWTTGLNIDPVTASEYEDATIHLWGNDDVLKGWMCLAVPCSSDQGGAEAEAARIAEQLSDDFVGALKQWRNETHEAAEAFWAHSAIEMDDKLLENTWYENVYLRRCTYRGGKIAPGLALPSTVQDYSMWHGDYHMNFNYQQPFVGDYGSNHVETGDSYFPGLEYMIENGRMVAEKYWSARGAYVALSGYPFRIDADPFGTGPLSRLAYCTGWAMNHYWSRYLHTYDKDWLAEVGYPVIRDCALFCADFLELREDGQYHAYPSVQGESMFTGREEDYTDQPQVIRNIRYCLSAAVKAAGELGIDEQYQAEWAERVEKLVPTDEVHPDRTPEQRRRFALNPPQFIGIDHENVLPAPGDLGHELRLTMDSHMWRCSFNTLPWYWMSRIRNDAFLPDRDLALVRAHIARWRMPSGHLRSMTASDHGYIGAYGESMGIIAPIQEMMLQSWDGSIRVFPAWPTDMNGNFTTLRAEGAFLVSCSFTDGRVGPITITSEKGQPCRIQNPWPGEVEVIYQTGKPHAFTMEDDKFICFETEPGARYEVAPLG